MDTLLSILLVVFFVFVNAFFSGTEMAVISLNDAKMHKLAEDGDKKARRVIKFIDNPGNFLATIQVGVTLAGFLSSAFAANSFASRLALWADPASVHPWMESVWTVVITIVLSYFSLVLGELVPKRIAQNMPEKWAFAAAGIVKFFGALLRPFVWFLTKSTNFVLRLFRIDPNQTDKPVTEEEIRMMVDVGSESGNIEDTEKEMIENVFEFNDKEVSEIMTHRKKIVSLPIDADYDEVMRVAREEKFTRIPVYKDTIDDIIGILHIKDLIGIMPPDEKDMSYHADAIGFQTEKLAIVTTMINKVVAKYKLISGGIPQDNMTDNEGNVVLGQVAVKGELTDLYERNGDVITPEFEKIILDNWIMPDGTFASDNIVDGVVVDKTVACRTVQYLNTLDGHDRRRHIQVVSGPAVG